MTDTIILNQPWWLALLLFVIAVLFLVIKQTSNFHILHSLKDLFSFRKQEFQQEIHLFGFPVPLLLLIFSFQVVLLLVFYFYGLSVLYVLSFFKLLVFSVLFFVETILVFYLYRGLAILFNVPGLSVIMERNNILSYSTLAIIHFPALLVLLFAKEDIADYALYFMLFSLGFFELFRVLKSYFQFIRSYGVQFIHIILYLCTLETIRYLVIYYLVELYINVSI